MHKLLLFIMVALLIGCAAPQTTKPDETQPSQPQQTDQQKTTEEEQVQEAQKKLEEFKKKQQLQEQQLQAEAQELYRLALSYRDKGDFEKAKDLARIALEKWPTHEDARKLLDEINRLTTAPAKPAISDITAKLKAQIQALRLEVLHHIRTGDRFLSTKEYDKALEEYSEAELKLTVMPDIPDKSEWLPRITQKIKDIETTKKEEEKHILELQRKTAEAEQLAHAEAEKKEMVTKIANLLELAYMAFDQKRYDQCIMLCDKILFFDPHYSVAIELKDDAKRARTSYIDRQITLKKINVWKSITSADGEIRIPYQDVLNYPPRDKWEEIEKRAQLEIFREEEITETEEARSVRNKLNSIRVESIPIERGSLQDYINHLKEVYDLKIIIDYPEISKATIDIERQIQFRVTNKPLATVLKFLLDQYGLDYLIQEDGIILVTVPQLAQGKPILELYDIRDIVTKLTDFPGPSLDLAQLVGGGGAAGFAPPPAPEEGVPKVEATDIMDLIKNNIAKDTWDDPEGRVSINVTPNNQLIIMHNREVHKQIREFLAKLRSYTGLMVSVTVRFLSVYDDFLEDIGIDIIRRPADRNFDFFGSGATDIDDSTGGAQTAGQGMQAQLGPGFVVQRVTSEFYDLRGQTFHTLLRLDPVAAAAGVAIVEDPTSGRTTNQGGLGLQYSWLGQQALQMVLRAVHKHHKATTLQAPKVTVFNTQRANIVSLSRIAYVRDYNITTGGLGGGYDPEIGYLTHGLVFEIKPVVSHDRKYVTLEIRAALAEIQAMRQIVLSVGFLAQAAPMPIQLPWILFQKTESTVLVPDRGTLVISGFKQVQLNDIQSGVPFLENIPIISFFFQKKAKLHERSRLYILITPEIIDLSEYERRILD